MAYPYMSPDKLERVAELGSELDLFIDSGAFTAWQARKEIRLQDYCDFLHRLPVRPECYVALDVVGNPQRTRENFDEMLKQGLRPVPVWTRGDTPESLEHYFTHSDTVALGGLAKLGTNPVPYLMATRKLTRGRKVHLFGMTRLNLIKALRPYSCDSSSFTMAARYGRCAVYMGGGRMQLVSRQDFLRQPPAAVVAALGRMGFDLLALRHDESWRGRGSLSSAITIASWLLLSRDVQRHCGTKLYLAQGTEPSLDAVWAEWRRLRHVMEAA